MKRTFIIILLATICSLFSMAQDRPDITHQSTGGDRIEFKPSSAPTLKYRPQTQEISVTNCQSDYYIVEINESSTDLLVYSGMVSGYGDVIDASMLLSGVTYTISLKDDNGEKCLYTFENGIIIYIGTITRLVGKSVMPTSMTLWGMYY